MCTFGWQAVELVQYWSSPNHLDFGRRRPHKDTANILILDKHQHALNINLPCILFWHPGLVALPIVLSFQDQAVHDAKAVVGIGRATLSQILW